MALAKDNNEVFYPAEIEARDDILNRRENGLRLLLRENVMNDLRAVAASAGLDFEKPIT